jgi:hypothetical protein
MNMQVDTWTTRQKENVFALSIVGKEEKEYYNQQYHLRSARIFCHVYDTHPWSIRLLWFKLLFGNRGVTHLIIGTARIWFPWFGRGGENTDESGIRCPSP